MMLDVSIMYYCTYYSYYVASRDRTISAVLAIVRGSRTLVLYTNTNTNTKNTKY